jgi:integrase/recombinase XerD
VSILALDEVGRTGLMLQTLLETGARASELVQLRVEEVGLAVRVITIRQGKGGRRREVPILQAVDARLEPTGGYGRPEDRPAR